MLDDSLTYFPELEKARLCLFGSSKNGFGFRDSDLDICMTLEGHENAEVSSIWKGFKSLFCLIVNLS
jgi:DNA polymerase sigma